jgi:hypothetical protein
MAKKKATSTPSWLRLDSPGRFTQDLEDMNANKAARTEEATETIEGEVVDEQKTQQVEATRSVNPGV